MRRNLMLALALGVVLSLGVAAIASAASTTLRAGNLILTFGGTISPKALPKHDLHAGHHDISPARSKPATAPTPRRCEKSIVDIDKDVKINVKGYPVCKAGQLEARDTKAAMKVCGNTVLGEGIAHVEIAFPEQKPILVTSPLTVFNGGEKGGKVMLLIHVFLTVPVPAAIVTTVTIKGRAPGSTRSRKSRSPPAAAARRSTSISSSARPTATRARRSATSKPNAPTASSKPTRRSPLQKRSANPGRRRYRRC